MKWQETVVDKVEYHYCKADDVVLVYLKTHTWPKYEWHILTESQFHKVQTYGVLISKLKTLASGNAPTWKAAKLRAIKANELRLSGG